MHTVYLADNPETTWPAPALGATWNTWATPHVTRDTLTRILGAAVLSDDDRYAALHIDTCGRVRFLETDGTTTDLTTFSPDTDGLYDLAPLGWTFLTQDAS